MIIATATPKGKKTNGVWRLKVESDDIAKTLRQRSQNRAWKWKQTKGTDREFDGPFFGAGEVHRQLDRLAIRATTSPYSINRRGNSLEMVSLDDAAPYNN